MAVLLHSPAGDQPRWWHFGASVDAGHADMTIKQRALELTAQASTPPGRYRPKDAVLAFLESL